MKKFFALTIIAVFILSACGSSAPNPVSLTVTPANTSIPLSVDGNWVGTSTQEGPLQLTIEENVVVEFTTKPCGLPLDINFQDLEGTIEDASFSVSGSIPTSTGNLTVELIGSIDSTGTSMIGTMSITGRGDPRSDTWKATKE